MLVHVLQLFKGITAEANSLLHDLQESLHSQEHKLTAYARQQREVGISFLTGNCFDVSVFLLLCS